MRCWFTAVQLLQLSTLDPLVLLRSLYTFRTLSASGFNCRYQNPYIKLITLVELAITLYQEFWDKMHCQIFYNPLCEHPNHPFGPFWKLQVRGNFFVCPQIYTVATSSLTYKQQIHVGNFFSKYFFSQERFFYGHSIFF